MLAAVELVAHCCKSAKDKDLDAQKCLGGDVFTWNDALACGCSGGSGGGDLDEESSLVLLLLSELLIATAKASELRLELMGRFEIPPPLLLNGKLRFLLSQT